MQNWGWGAAGMFQSKICIINHKMLLFCIVGLHLCLGQAQPKLLPGNPLIRTDRISIHWHRGISLSYTRTFCIQASNAIHFFSSLLGKPSKKITVESVSMLIPRWGTVDNKEEEGSFDIKEEDGSVDIKEEEGSFDIKEECVEEKDPLLTTSHSTKGK